MTNQLMKLAGGKVVLVLEGGYELNALAQCGKLCVEALLGREVRNFSIDVNLLLRDSLRVFSYLRLHEKHSKQNRIHMQFIVFPVSSKCNVCLSMFG